MSCRPVLVSSTAAISICSRLHLLDTHLDNTARLQLCRSNTCAYSREPEQVEEELELSLVSICGNMVMTASFGSFVMLTQPRSQSHAHAYASTPMLFTPLASSLLRSTSQRLSRRLQFQQCRRVGKSTNHTPAFVSSVMLMPWKFIPSTTRNMQIKSIPMCKCHQSDWRMGTDRNREGDGEQLRLSGGGRQDEAGCYH